MPKFKCPHCGKTLQIIPVRDSGRHVLASVGTLIDRARGAATEPEAQEPERRAVSTRMETTRQPVASASLESQFKTPLAIACTSAVAVFVVTVPLLYALEAKWPFLFGYGLGMVTFFVFWLNGVGFFKDAMFSVKNVAEEVLDRDLDGDGQVGQSLPPEIRFVPVRQAGQPPSAITLPATPRQEPRIWLNERRSVKAGVLVGMLTEAAETGNWTREYWQSRGIGQKEWADIKAFCEQFDIWKTDDTALLREFVTRLRQDGNERTVTN